MLIILKYKDNNKKQNLQITPEVSLPNLITSILNNATANIINYFK
jgi:hypothetical protein